MTSIIDVRELSRTFGEHIAVDGITFTVAAGEVFGLLGPNGAGKTTTVRLLNGILPSSGGSMRVFGLDPSLDGESVRRKTGVLTETPALYERLTARENLAFFAELQGIPVADVERSIDEILGFFDLTSRAQDKVGTYSKGMKQRLALARALIHKPPLLFLDEPTSGLDPEAAQQVNEFIADLRGSNGQTVVLATHNLFEAQRLCDRVAIMRKGKILAVGGFKDLARRLWPVTWVDVELQAPATADLATRLRAHRGVIQVELNEEAVAVQVENEAVIPDLVRHLVGHGESVLRVNPRDYTLEDIYFALQAGTP